MARLLPEPRSRIVESNWVRVALLIFVLQVFIFYASVSSPMSQTEAVSLAAQYGTLNDTLSSQQTILGKAWYLFSHNVVIALGEVIPGFGLGLFVFSSYVTSRTLEALAIAQPGTVAGLPAQLVLTSLFLVPHTWLELPAYAIATTEGCSIIYAGLRHRIRLETPRLLAVLIFILLELIVAALFEAAEIASPSLALLLWLPALLIFAAVYFSLRSWLREGLHPPPSVAEVGTGNL
jgi:uncharacterized membrane protein SpoIIM required for sporulation